MKLKGVSKMNNNLRVCVLLSCMHQSDHSIIHKSNIQCDVVVVNQCDSDSIERFSFQNEKGEECSAVFVNTTERGLSRSRNMAIGHAPDNAICVIADDDEVFESDAPDKIIKIYDEHPECSVVAFSLIRKDGTRRYPANSYKIGFKQALSVNSLQITFKKSSVQAHNIRFDILLGSGTGNGGGEENRFILDCLRAKLVIKYFPIIIATVLPGESQWFYGYTSKFMEDKGWASRRILGSFLGLVYVVYSAFHLHSRYKCEMTFSKATWSMLKGFYSKRIK